MEINYNKVGIWARIACFLIGWNSELLKECGEASRRTLRKYISAIVILSILWGTIGYCFAERYVGMENLVGKLAMSSTFIVIIVCVERYIILTGKLGWTGVARFIMAVLMAVLGSTIFDQIIFKNDIEFKMKEILTEQINAEVPKRNQQIDAQLHGLKIEIDSLNKANQALREEIAQNPASKYTTYSSQKRYVGDNPDGTPRYVTEVVTENHIIESPLIAQATANDSIIKRAEANRTELQNKKLKTEEIVRAEFEAAPIGFLQELEALFHIILNNKVAAVFYVCLFLFLMSLELLVVMSKSGDGESDYDMVVRHQQNIKEETLKRMEEGLLNKK